jgi:hypothetical protein
MMMLEKPVTLELKNVLYIPGINARLLNIMVCILPYLPFLDLDFWIDFLGAHPLSCGTVTMVISLCDGFGTVVQPYCNRLVTVPKPSQR